MVGTEQMTLPECPLLHQWSWLVFLGVLVASCESRSRASLECAVGGGSTARPVGASLLAWPRGRVRRAVLRRPARRGREVGLKMRAYRPCTLTQEGCREIAVEVGEGTDASLTAARAEIPLTSTEGRYATPQDVKGLALLRTWVSSLRTSAGCGSRLRPGREPHNGPGFDQEADYRTEREKGAKGNRVSARGQANRHK
jgi:hypothetical protein